MKIRLQSVNFSRSAGISTDGKFLQPVFFTKMSKNAAFVKLLSVPVFIVSKVSFIRLRRRSVPGIMALPDNRHPKGLWVILRRKTRLNPGSIDQWQSHLCTTHVFRKCDCSGCMDFTHFCCRTGLGDSSIHADFRGCNSFLLMLIPEIEILPFRIRQDHNSN